MSDDDSERPEAAKAWNAGGVKVWAECYPGGDMMIELGGIDCDRDLYVNSAEAKALQEVINELLGDGDE